MTTTTQINTLPELGNAQKSFYPTPAALAALLLDGPNWSRVGAVLEPSARKGDLAAAIMNMIELKKGYDYRRNQVDLDCIEIDKNLRHILTGKEYRVIHDDFLTFSTYKVYDAIIMNPPFDRGAEHLLKALSIQQKGGYIACILNAQTIKNPHTYARKSLVNKLTEYGAEITFHDGAFADAERKTGVEVAIVKVSIPRDDESDSSILDGLRADRSQRQQQPQAEDTDVIKEDFIDAIIDRFNFEAAAGCKLIREYRALLPYLKNAIDKDSYPSDMLKLKVDDHSYGDATENEFIRSVRKKYWSALFQNPKFTRKLTSNLQTELMGKVNDLRDYDFTFFNIMTIRINIEKKVIEGIHKTIIDLFDDWTVKYHWDEMSKNRHYFNGWKTNDAFAVNKRVIIPCYNAFSDYDGRFQPRYGTIDKLRDIEKVFDYLSGRMTQYDFVSGALERAERDQQTKKIHLKYFMVTFYKKGTCHVEFTDLDVLHKFNLYAAKDKNWLPPCYGKKAYADMAPEEQDVIDSFEGEKSYADVMSRADYFLSGPADTGLPKINAGAQKAMDLEATPTPAVEMTIDEFIASME